MTETLIDIEEIEFEGDDKGSEFKEPFDPNAIDVDISVINLGSLLDQLKYDEIDLSPEFQRSSNVWSKENKSRLIESVLLGLPLPSFYFSQDPTTNKLVVVDGLQRLCTFKEFWIEKNKHQLKLKGMKILTNLEGKTVDDLDRSQIRNMQSLKITINTLRKNTPTKVKYVLFQRINTAGIPLNQQEMRNALYQGTATHLLKRMVVLPSFYQATGNRISTKRMADCDFANRFLAFYLNKEHYKGELDSFMGDTLDQVNKMDSIKIEDIYKTFDKSMSVCVQLLKDKAFRRPDPNNQDTYLKVNKAIFEALSVSIARLTYKEQEILIAHKQDFSNKIKSLFLEDEFIKSVTSDTSSVSRVNLRFSKINNLIKSVLYYDN